VAAKAPRLKATPTAANLTIFMRVSFIQVARLTTHCMRTGSQRLSHRQYTTDTLATERASPYPQARIYAQWRLWGLFC
jgi:hypothetical protein